MNSPRWKQLLGILTPNLSRGKESEFEECKRLKETVLRKEVSIKESNEQRKLENSDLRNEITKLADLCKDVSNFINSSGNEGY